MKKDYYEILGVSKSASADDVKKAYRKLAREHHPDMVKDGDKKQAEERFKEINEAYQVLGDAEKRKMYDQFGHAGPAGFNPQGGTGGPQGQWGPFTYTYSSGGNMGFDPFDIFEEFFGFRGFNGQRKPHKGKNLYYEMRVDFVDAIKGAEREVNIESGKMKIKIPKGVRDGTELRFEGKGLEGPQGAPHGDLFITLRVPTPKGFERYGDDLVTAAELSFVQAILGDTIQVNVVDEKSQTGMGFAKLKIPESTQPNTQFRIRGKGMPRLRGSGNGDVIVQTFMTIPKKLSKKQKQLLEDYSKLS